MGPQTHASHAVRSHDGQVVGVFVRLVIVALVLGACSTPRLATPTADPLSGSYVVKGGGAALEVYQALVDGFNVLHPTVRFGFEDVGSGSGMKLAASGDVDLATSSATAAPDIASRLTLVPVGSSGTAVIVNAQNPISALSKTQVHDLFSGTTTQWSALGSPVGTVFPVIREVSSALRGNFDAYFFDGKAKMAAGAVELNTGDDMLRAVASASGVIGMVTITKQMRAESRVRPVAIDGMLPTRENITSGRYPVQRPLFLAYNAALAKPAITAFIAYVTGPEGQRIVGRMTAGE